MRGLNIAGDIRLCLGIANMTPAENSSINVERENKCVTLFLKCNEKYRFMSIWTESNKLLVVDFQSDGGAKAID